MGVAAIEETIAFIQGLDDAPADNLEGSMELARELRRSPPEEGGDFDELMKEFLAAMSKAREYAGPGYLAYIPGGGLYTSALGEFLARSYNRFVGMWLQGPAAVAIEENVTRWLCDEFDMPAEAQGILTTGGSLANLSAMVTARHARLGEDFTDGVYYVSQQAHASVTKAATIAGFSRRNLRIVPTDAELRMDVDALRSMVAEDRRDGHRPFLVVPSGGTTNTGAIDPLDDDRRPGRRRGSLDARRCGVRRLLPADRTRPRLAHGHRARGLGDPRSAQGAVPAVRDRRARGARRRGACAQAHYEGAAYLQDLPPSGELPNYSEYSLELSREFRGMRVWMPLRLHGVGAFREALDEKLDLARRLADALRDDPNVELCWEPQLTVVAVPARRRATTTSARRRSWIGSTPRSVSSCRAPRSTGATCCGRASCRTARTRDRIEECIDIVQRAAADLVG